MALALPLPLLLPPAGMLILSGAAPLVGGPPRGEASERDCARKSAAAST